jgi:hypothetical protein
MHQSLGLVALAAMAQAARPTKPLWSVCSSLALMNSR